MKKLLTNSRLKKLAGLNEGLFMGSHDKTGRSMEEKQMSEELYDILKRSKPKMEEYLKTWSERGGSEKLLEALTQVLEDRFIELASELSAITANDSGWTKDF